MADDSKAINRVFTRNVMNGLIPSEKEFKCELNLSDFKKLDD